MRKIAYALMSMFGVSLLLLSLGCEGPQGPPGEGVGDLDTQPPTVRLTTPARSDTVIVDSFEIAATASDNEGVSFVEFFFDGSSTMGSKSAIDSTSPYRFVWYLDSSGHSFGIYPLMARAVDLSDNAADSAPVLIHYQGVPQTDLLYYADDFIGAPFGEMTMPDEFSDRYFNVRFEPAYEGRLLEIHFEFLQPELTTLDGDQVTGGIDVMLYSWLSNEDGLPETPPLDSLLLLQSEQVYSTETERAWNVIDVSDWDLEFSNPDRRFHIGYSVPGDADYGALVDQRRATPIVLTYYNEVSPNPATHRSIEFDPDLGWGTMQDHWGDERQLHIRALVEYSTGQVALIRPEPDRGSREWVEVPANKTYR